MKQFGILVICIICVSYLFTMVLPLKIPKSAKSNSETKIEIDTIYVEKEIENPNNIEIDLDNQFLNYQNDTTYWIITYGYYLNDKYNKAQTMFKNSGDVFCYWSFVLKKKKKKEKVRSISDVIQSTKYTYDNWDLYCDTY